MARYSALHSTIWADMSDAEFSPEAMILWTYLISNEHGNSIGLYRLPYEYIKADTGFNNSTIDRAMDTIIRAGWIAYDKPTKTVFIKNYLKRNKLTNEKHAKGAALRAKDYIKSPLYREFYDRLAQLHPKFSNLFDRPIDTPKIGVSPPLPLPLPTREGEGDAPAPPREEPPVLSPDQSLSQRIQNYWLKTIGQIIGYGLQDLMEWVTGEEPIPVEIVEYAIDITKKRGKRSPKYTNGILKDFFNDGVRDLASLEEEKQRQAGTASNPEAAKDWEAILSAVQRGPLHYTEAMDKLSQAAKDALEQSGHDFVSIGGTSNYDLADVKKAFIGAYGRVS